MIDQLKQFLRPLAPTLAAALGGPYSGIARKYVAECLGGNGGQADDDVGDLIKNLDTPAELQKIKDAEQQFKSEMKQLDVDVFALESKNKVSAREQNIGSRPQMIITIIFLSGYFLMLASIFFVEVSDTINMRSGENSMMGELQILFGVLTAGIGQILSFWFGGMLPRRDPPTK